MAGAGSVTRASCSHSPSGWSTPGGGSLKVLSSSVRPRPAEPVTARLSSADSVRFRTRTMTR